MSWDNLKINIWNVIISAFGLQALENAIFINNPLWFVGVLLFCYIQMYLIVIISGKLSLNPAPFFLMMIVIGIIVYNSGLNTILVNSRTARGLYGFFWGLLLAYIVKRIKSSKTIDILAFLIVIVVPFLIPFANEFVNQKMNYIMTFGYYSAVILLFTSETVSSLFSHRTWSTLAEVSYNIYVWHAPMFVLYAIFFFVIGNVPDFSNIGTLIMMILGIYIVGVLSYQFIDKPFRKHFSRIFGL